MTPEGGARKRSSPWADIVLMFATVVFGVVVTEGIVRYLNGQSLVAFPLPDPISWKDVKPQDFDAVPLSAGVQKAWFEVPPPPLPNRAEPPPGWQDLFDHLRATLPERSQFRPGDAFKVWNSAFIPALCKRGYFELAPDHIYVYDPPDGNPSPPYRFYPGVTAPDHLVTNQIGWRGPPVEAPRGARTIRIVFVGSSTVVDSHFAPYSYPELAGHWLNMWAASKKLDIRFEVLNSARESNISTDIANIVRTEILPLRPDLVVYYEGGNQFDIGPLLDHKPEGKPVRPGTGASVAPAWLREASRYSALLGRVQAALGLVSSDLDGREWPKPDYKIVWPAGLDEQDPDLAYPDLPVHLNDIERDLDRIRADLAGVGSGFALSSFIWMVRDGMVVNPAQRGGILDQLNIMYWPYRYRDMERLANFQNRFFAKYARVHDIPFIDMAGLFPFDPELFTDAVHSDYSGTRLRGWIAFQQLLPTVEKHLADGSWPSPPGPSATLPTFKPREIPVPCRGPSR
jgi:hypothetical protein